VNRLRKAGEEVFTLTRAVTANGVTHPAGTFYVRAKGSTRRTLENLATELGVSFTGIRAPTPAPAPLHNARIGLWDQYGGSIDAGWARWILEQFEFPFTRVFAPTLNAGNLNRSFDVLVLVGGAIGGGGGRGGGAGAALQQADIPPEYQNQLGRISADTTLPQLEQFVRNGGTIVAIGESASNLAASLKLPIENHLVENGAALPRTRFFTPGSVLAVHVDTTLAVARGLSAVTNVFFDDSPVFKLGSNAAAAGVTPIAWFDSRTPLRSGWSWGQHYLEQGVVALEAKLGRGRVLLFGPEILKRAQPHPTFKFLFNGLLQ
jgi:hypothetical protein